MEINRQIDIKLTKSEIEEIEPIIERLNGLYELLLILPKFDSTLIGKVNDEKIILEQKKDGFLKRIIKRYSYDHYEIYEKIIDFSSSILSITIIQK